MSGAPEGVRLRYPDGTPWDGWKEGDPLSWKSGIGVTVDSLRTPDEVSERIGDLLRGARTFRRRIEIIIDVDRDGYRVRSYHEALSAADPFTPPAVQS